MAEYIPTREEAWELLKKYNETDSLIDHGRAVEAVMGYAAQQAGLSPEEVEKWRIIGLVHDLDYEKYPDVHCQMTKKILEEAGWSQEYIRAILAHGWGTCTDVEPQNQLEKTLYAIDELTGLVMACALVRPSKSVQDLEVKSVMKKWKTAAFAAGANREIILHGAEMLGVELDELIRITIEGMRTVEGF